MPFQHTYVKQKRAPGWAALSIVAFLTFLVGLGIGIGQAAHIGSVDLEKQLADERIEGRTFLGAITGFGSRAPRDISDEINGEVDFDLFWEVWRDLKSSYYKQPVDDKQLFYGALQGLTDSVGDSYTAFFQPSEAETFEESLRGEFSGIGAEIGVKDDQLQIIAPLPDTPADRAGVRARDLIVEIDGEESLQMDVGEAVSKIRGEQGTEVVLTLGRSAVNEKGEQDIELIETPIVRDVIVVKSARYFDKGGGVYHIEIRSFNEDVAATFAALVDEIAQKKPKGIIIDVRNNPGGFLDRVVTMLGEWLPGEEVVLQRRQGEIVERFRADRGGRLKGIPTVVLIDEGSASASEILAGALQDYEVATIVGKTSFGKGSVQDYIDYDDGSAMKVTVSEWLTPLGRSINEEGIVPDLEVERTVEDYNADRDPQLDKAIEILKAS